MNQRFIDRVLRLLLRLGLGLAVGVTVQAADRMKKQLAQQKAILVLLIEGFEPIFNAGRSVLGARPTVYKRTRQLSGQVATPLFAGGGANSHRLRHPTVAQKKHHERQATAGFIRVSRAEVQAMKRRSSALSTSSSTAAGRTALLRQLSSILEGRDARTASASARDPSASARDLGRGRGSTLPSMSYSVSGSRSSQQSVNRAAQAGSLSRFRTSKHAPPPLSRAKMVVQSQPSSLRNSAAETAGQAKKEDTKARMGT